MDARYSIVPRYTLARPEKAYLWVTTNNTGSKPVERFEARLLVFPVNLTMY